MSSALTVSEFTLFLEQRVAAFLCQKGASSTEAEAAGKEITRALADLLGGQLVYFAKDRYRKVRERHARIVSEFDGSNHAALAMKHGLGLAQVYKVLKEDRAAQKAKKAAKTTIPTVGIGW